MEQLKNLCNESSFDIRNILRSVKMSDGQMTGQILTDLSRALEHEKANANRATVLSLIRSKIAEIRRSSKFGMYMDPETQNDLILKALKNGDKLTPLDMLKRFGYLRASGRIFDLRIKGHAIKTTMIKTGDGKRVAEYSIELTIEN
jgi:hypothetical protein